MPLDLATEIARRLDASAESVSGVLANVVERIRQQVSYYGYARVAGLGTFRGDEDRLVFEPDPTLSEHVNLKFAGLGELRMPSGPDVREAGITKPDFGAAGAFGSIERGAEPHEAEAEPEPEAEGEREPETEGEFDADVEMESPSETSGRGDFGAGADEESEREHPVYSFREEEFVDDADREEDFIDDEAWKEEAVDDAWGMDERSAEEREVEHDDAVDQEVDVGNASDDSPVVQWRPIDLRPGSGEDDHDELTEAAATTFSADHDFEETESEFREQDEFDDELRQVDEVDEPGAEGVFEGEDEVGAGDEVDGSGVDEIDDEAVFATSGSETDGGDRLHESLRGPAAGTRRHARAPARSTGERNRSVIWLGAGVIVLVAIAAIAFFALRPNESQEPPLAEQAEPEVLPDTSATPAAGDTMAAEVPAAAPPEEEIESADDDSTPLRSSNGIDPSQGGYTIIVYSESSEQRASDVAAQYRGEGFRADVLEYEDDGATLLRVGIGQFTTLTEAAESRNRLAGNELPDDAWVRRVP